MATRIQVRRDTAANWRTSGTTTLAAGEIGFETDTLLFKIGDGSQTWTNLEYAGGTEPIRYNPSGTSVTDLNANDLLNNGNSKYLISGADIVANEPSGLSTATDGQLLVTVGKFDYTGTSAANERYLMTLQTLTTGRFFYRTYNGSWSSWYEAVKADPSTGNVTIAGDLDVNGADITTTSTGTATVFNANATTLNVGQAATTVSIGAATGTTTINNATTAITGAATVGSTLAVTGNTALTGDLAVNGGDITTSAATATVFDSNATSVDIAGAATTLNIADAPTTNQTINIGTGLTASGATKTINIGTGGAAGSTTNINLGDADGGSVNIARDLAVDTNVLKVDATNNRVGINVTSPTQALDVLGNVLASGTFNGFTLANMCAETLSDYPKTGGASRIGSFAFIHAYSSIVGLGTWGGNQSTTGQIRTGYTSASTPTLGLAGANTLLVILTGGVTWTLSSGIIRPNAGTWTVASYGTTSTTGQDPGYLVFAVRTA